MHYLTRIQIKIITDLIKQGGEAVSLFKIAQRISADYKNAWSAVDVLERDKVVVTERSDGVGMLVRLYTGVENPIGGLLRVEQSELIQTTNDKRQEALQDD